MSFRPIVLRASSEIIATVGVSKFNLRFFSSARAIGQAMGSRVDVGGEMPRDEKFTVNDIPTWTEYFQKNKERLQKKFSSFKLTEEVDKYAVDPKLNNKVSLWEGNITQLEIDAIVNAANHSLLGGGGVDGAIHAAAGPGLKAECKTLHGCKTGEAKITEGYLLPAKHVIHTVGPVGEKPDLLNASYNNCLRILTERTLRVLAFPCISTGVYGYPNEPAAHIAIGTTRKFLEKNPDSIDRVIFCLFLKKDVEIYENLMQVYFPVA